MLGNASCIKQLLFSILSPASVFCFSQIQTVNSTYSQIATSAETISGLISKSSAVHKGSGDESLGSEDNYWFKK